MTHMEASPVWRARLAEPGWGVKVACAIADQFNVVIYPPLAVIRTVEAALVNLGLHASVSGSQEEDGVCCVVALPVVATLA